jgi:outer membrane protein TolC
MIALAVAGAAGRVLGTPATDAGDAAAGGLQGNASDADRAAAGWTAAAPADMLERGPWWQLFGDPVLNQMADSIEVNNQNVAAAVASYAQARALVAEQRATLFPAWT